MTSELLKLGYEISRSGTYLRILPKRSNTAEGKRHVVIVPVKLLRPENSLRKKNIDRMFAKSFIDDIQSIDSLFGHASVTHVSIDDKARIPLGIVAAQKHSAMLMKVDYRVRLPDHDFSVGQQHKLIPSVYAECVLKEDGSLDYAGKTIIRIRSGKHDKSTASTHARDMQEIFDSGAIKAKNILMIQTDGAADEAPRFPKTMATAIALFLKLGLDVLCHGVNAAGLSAFNPVERRMAPLSKLLSGVVLKHDHYGSHLG